MKFITYTSHDEVIVTVLEMEHIMLDTLFEGGSGNGDRKRDDYDRKEAPYSEQFGSVMVTARLRVD